MFLNSKSKSHLGYHFSLGFAFSIDQYATTAGLYGYSFNTIFPISKVPVEDFFAVGLMITLSISISSYFKKTHSLNSQILYEL